MMDIVLTFSHSTDYNCVHMTGTTGTIHLVDLRGRKVPGYIQLHKDNEDVVIFEVK